MTMLAAAPAVTEEIEITAEARRDAEAAYIGALSNIVNLSTLAGGRHGYDFQVEVSAGDLHEVTQRIVDLEYELRDSTGVHFRTYAIPV